MHEGGAETTTDATTPASGDRCVACGAPITQSTGFCSTCGAPTPTDPSAIPLNDTVRREVPTWTQALTKQWWIGIAGSLVGWWLLIVFAGPGQPGLAVGYLGASGTVLQLVNIVVWLTMPITGYLDIRHVREHSDWDPSTPIWVVAMTVWLINLIAAAAYLYRRHEAVGVP